MTLVHFFLKLLIAWLVAFKVRTSVMMADPAGKMKVDPTMKDASIASYLTFENELFKSHWAWANQAFFPDDSAATGFPTLKVDESILPNALTSVVKPVVTVPAVPAVNTVASALGLTTAAKP